MITVLSTFNIKPEKVDKFKAAMLVNQEAVRREVGNEEMRLFQDKTDPTKFFVYGRNGDGFSLDAHTDDVEARGIEAEVAECLAQAPVTMNLHITKPFPSYDIEASNFDPSDEILFVPYRVKDGYKEKLIALFESHVALTREDKANVLFHFYSVEEDSNMMVVYERWRSEPGIRDNFMKEPHTMEAGALLMEAVDGKIEDYLHMVVEL